MKLLVTYASKYGSTAEIAEVIDQELSKHEYEVEVKPVEQAGNLVGIDLDKLSFGEKMIIRSVKATVGDYCDWLVIRTWASMIRLAE